VIPFARPQRRRKQDVRLWLRDAQDHPCEAPANQHDPNAKRAVLHTQRCGLQMVLRLLAFNVSSAALRISAS